MNSVRLLDEGHEPQLVQGASFRAYGWLSAAFGREGASGEDASGYCEFSKGCLFAIADGVGSDPGGREAARRLVAGLITPCELGFGPGHLQASVEALHREFVGDADAGTSTLVVATILAGELRLIHCGDSGAALISRTGELVYRTLGHGPVHYAIAAGALAPERLLEHEEHHLVDHVVGAEPLVLEWAGPMRMRKSDTLILASDGVLDNIDWSRLAPLVCSGAMASAANRLAQTVDAAIEAGGKDDDRSFWMIRRR
jgi:serine/threonine protein phosphatase PrpC